MFSMDTEDCERQRKRKLTCENQNMMGSNTQIRQHEGVEYNKKKTT